MEAPPPTNESEPDRERAGPLPRRSMRIGAALTLGILAAAVAWVLVDRSSSAVNSSPTATAVAAARPAVTPIDPIALSSTGLEKLTVSVDQPIYWAGPERGHLYELTRTTQGKVFVRYLPRGVRAGATQTTFLIVATYPFRNAFDALEKLPGGHRVRVAHGGVAVVDTRHPTSVHVAFPGVDYQIEIYDPVPAHALAVARSAALLPVPRAG